MKGVLVLRKEQVSFPRTLHYNIFRRRKANRDRANALLAEGKKAEARQYFERCIDITPQMAHKVIVVRTPKTLLLEICTN